MKTNLIRMVTLMFQSLSDNPGFVATNQHILQSLQEVIELFDRNLRNLVTELHIAASDKSVKWDVVLFCRVELCTTDVFQEQVALSHDVLTCSQYTGAGDDVAVADPHLIMYVVKSLHESVLCWNTNRSHQCQSLYWKYGGMWSYRPVSN